MLRNNDLYTELDRGYQESLAGSEGVTQREDDMLAEQREEELVEEQAIKRKMDYGEPQGCEVRVVGSGASAIAIEYTTYELNRRLAWARLMQLDSLREWLYASDAFISPALKCGRCGTEMTRGIWYNDDWFLSPCPDCDAVSWVQPSESVQERGVSLPPFDLSIADIFSTLSGNSERPSVPVNSKKHFPKSAMNDKRSAPGSQFGNEDKPIDVTARLKIENHFDDREAKSIVEMLHIIHDYVAWALKCLKDGDLDKVEELLGGLAFGLGDFITQPDINKLAVWHIPLGPSLMRVRHGGGDAGIQAKYRKGKRGDSDPEGKVRWDMSVAHIQHSMDKLTVAANAVEGILETVIRHGGNAKDLERAENIVSIIRRPFDASPEETIGQRRDFPRGSEKPTMESLWALARLGMLVFDSEMKLKDMRVGEYLQFKRRSAGLSVRDVSHSASMPQEKCQRIEGRQQMPTRSDVGRLCSIIPGASAKFALGLKGVA